jgi:hypothetical protein
LVLVGIRLVLGWYWVGIGWFWLVLGWYWLVLVDIGWY